MSTLASSFLDDLDDLDSDDEELAEGGGGEEEDDEEVGGEDDLDAVAMDLKQGSDLASVVGLRRSPAFVERLAKIEDSLSKPPTPIVGSIEENPEYQLIVSCNDLISQIDEEMLTVYRFVVELYSKKFPELESLVPGRLDYLNSVRAIGNEMDMTLVDLAAVLPAGLVISVSMTGSTTSGRPLSEEDLAQCVAGCEEAEALDRDRQTILGFVETRMTAVAPNLCALLDTTVAAQLLGLCGGLASMSKIPACNLQVIGQQKGKALGGFGAAATMPHTGIVYYSTVVQQAQPYLRRKALKVVAGKLSLASRIDLHQSEPSGAAGQAMRRELDDKFAKWDAPQEARTKKALPVPDERPSAKRGGKKARKYKEKFAMTETRKEVNRRSFADFSGEYGDDAMGSDLGMLGVKEGGKLRLPPKKEQKLAVKKQKRAIQMSSGKTNGLSSSLVFTPMNGIELVGGGQREAKVAEANQKWFAENSGFLSARPS